MKKEEVSIGIKREKKKWGKRMEERKEKKEWDTDRRMIEVHGVEMEGHGNLRYEEVVREMGKEEK